MAEGNGNDQATALLEEILESNPELAKQIEEWQNRSPAEQAQGGRKMFYGVVLPALGDLDSENRVQIEAVFEGLFRTIEQKTGARSRSS